MQRTWRLTDVELAAAWAQVAEGRLPKPLSFRSRTPLLDDYLREQAEVWQRLRARRDIDFDRLLATLSEPDIRIGVRGCDPRLPDNPAACIRMLGARRATNAYFIAQLPGETIGHSTGFTVTACDVLDLADLIVTALPAVEAGRQAEIVLGETEDGMDHYYRRSAVQWSLADDDSEQTRAAEFLRATATTSGTIEIAQGTSRFGPRGITCRALEWRDLHADGRYVITPGPPRIAHRADSTHLINMINAEIAEVVRAIRDERR